MLTERLIRIVGARADACGEILDPDDILIRTDQRLDHRTEIEPFVWRVAQRSVVEVEAIDIDECLLHWRFLKSKSQLPRESAPRPFGEPNRGVCGAYYIKPRMQAQGGK